MELVQGSDLLVHNGFVYMRTTEGLRRVDVIYRRIDDDFIDPLTFRPDSYVGTPGLFHAYQLGNVTIANAPGTGVADDKSVYAYVPEIIRYFLAEEPLLANVETHLCREPAGLDYTLDNLDRLVVKMVGESGGYGMLVGPHATQDERAAYAEEIRRNPANFIAHPTLDLSCAPCLSDGGAAPRHVDLRPFVLHGCETRIVPGAFCRVALTPGSLVVNSSQGGGARTSGSSPTDGMLSRSAQALYWIGRHLERAQHGCRLLAEQLESLKDRSVEEIDLNWRRVYRALGRVPLAGGLGSNLGDENFMLADAYTLVAYLTFEANNPDAIRSCLASARENARQVRDTLDRELWACLNVAFLGIRDLGIEDAWKDRPGDFFLATENAARTFWGVADSTMYRDESWHFSSDSAATSSGLSFSPDSSMPSSPSCLPASASRSPTGSPFFESAGLPVRTAASSRCGFCRRSSSTSL